MRQIKIIIIIFLFMASPFISQAQKSNSAEAKQTFSLSGFVKNDFFWDSRQTVSAREGHFLLWPTAIDKDIDGQDINAIPSFNYLSLQSRVSLAWKGTEALGAKISAKIESDFFAQNNSNINLFRLRHAYIKMKWSKTELLIGQYWIPMFTTACFPGTVSFNTGVPMNPFGRNPQIKISHTMDKIKLSAVAHSQRDYASRGPKGVSGAYLRNSLVPELTGMIDFTSDNITAGVGGAFKSIVPQIETDLGYATNEKLTSYSSYGFIKYTGANFSLKLKGIYGQNTPDYLSIGGFGVTKYDTSKGYQEYDPISSFAAWTDLSYSLGNTQIGIFGGFTKNLGAKNDIVDSGKIYGLGTNIASLYRVSPRIIYNTGKIRLASEFEYTVANHGTSFDAKNVAIATEATSNFRVLFAVYYFFNTK